MFEYEIEDVGLFLDSLRLPPPDHYEPREAPDPLGTHFRKVRSRDHKIVGFAAHDAILWVVSRLSRRSEMTDRDYSDSGIWCA